MSLVLVTFFHTCCVAMRAKLLIKSDLIGGFIMFLFTSLFHF